LTHLVESSKVFLEHEKRNFMVYIYIHKYIYLCICILGLLKILIIIIVLHSTDFFMFAIIVHFFSYLRVK